MGAKENLNGKASCMCPRVPCLLKLFGTFFFSLAVSLISSRQAVWSGLKAFIKLSPGLINTHFLLEILAQTHQRLLVIRWWHSEQPWLKHGHSSIQYSLGQSMYIKETACHNFILESEDYCYTLQTRSLFCFSIHFHWHCVSSSSSFSLNCSQIMLSVCTCITQGAESKTMQTGRHGFAEWDEYKRMPESCTRPPPPLPLCFSRNCQGSSFAFFCMLMIFLV